MGRSVLHWIQGRWEILQNNCNSNLFQDGKPELLLYPTNSTGQICGEGGNADRPLLFFQDLLVCTTMNSLVNGCATPQVLFALIGNFHLPSFVVVCVGISMTSTMLSLFWSATEILIWDYASMGLLEGPHFRENLSKCTFSFACLSWNLRHTVLFVACLCPSSESVETAPGTTWLKSTYLGQWHCWRHHTLIYHIYALKVIFHICLFKNAAACWLIIF